MAAQVTTIAVAATVEPARRAGFTYHLAWMFTELGIKVRAVDTDPDCLLTDRFLSEGVQWTHYGHEIGFGENPDLILCAGQPGTRDIDWTRARDVQPGQIVLIDSGNASYRLQDCHVIVPLSDHLFSWKSAIVASEHNSDLSRSSLGFVELLGRRNVPPNVDGLSRCFAAWPFGTRIGRIHLYPTLEDLSLEARKPMFLLTPADGAVGTASLSVQDCYGEYRTVAEEIAGHAGIRIPSD